MITHPAQLASYKPSGGFGRLYLHDPELPPLLCTLLELHPEQCLGFVPFADLNPETALAWQEKLMPRQKLRLRLEFMRGLPGFEMEGTVQKAVPAEDGVEIGLSFTPTSSLHRAVREHEAQQEEAETLEPIEPSPAGSSGLHKSSVMTLMPLSADEIMAMHEAAGRLPEAAASTRADVAVRPPIEATVEIERPAELRAALLKPAAASKPQEPSPAAPEATIAMERPAEFKGTAAALTPGSTASITRPVDPKAIQDIRANPRRDSSVIQAAGVKGAGDATDSLTAARDEVVANAGETIQIERRAGKRDSGLLTVVTALGQAQASKRLGEVLVQMGKLTAEQVEEVVRLAQENGQRMGRCLLAWELVSPDVLCRALSIQSGLPMTVLEGEKIPDSLSKIFPLPMMMRHNFVPFDESAAVLCIAAGNPVEAETVKELERLSRKVVEIFLAREDQVAKQLDWMRVKMKTRSRRSLRYKAALPALYQFCSRLGVRTDKDVYEGNTVNLSGGGFLIEAPQAPGDPGDMLTNGLYVNVCIKAKQGEIWSICDVREIRLVPDTTPSRWLLGVEIVDINEESRARLKEICVEAKKGKSEKNDK